MMIARQPENSTQSSYYSASVEGYASIFNTPDQNGDIIAPGAFQSSLQTRAPIRMLYQHKVETPIGRWRTLEEDARGLFVRGDLILSSAHAREVFALLEGGAIDGLSIGFQTIKATKEPGGRRILKANLWEISIVTFPMASSARITHLGTPQKTSVPVGERSLRPTTSSEGLMAATLREASTVLTK